MNTLISKSVVPHGGFYFVETGVELRKGSYDELKKLVIDHRAANGLPPGDPDAEIQDQICSRWPAGCRNKKTLVAMAVKFGAVLERMISKRESLVDQAEADRRASICSQCPKNVPSEVAHKGGCAKCQKAASVIIGKFRSLMLQGKATAGDLKTCNVCGCDNQLQVWIPMSALSTSIKSRDEYPEHCWKR